MKYCRKKFTQRAANSVTTISSCHEGRRIYDLFPPWDSIRLSVSLKVALFFVLCRIDSQMFSWVSNDTHSPPPQHNLISFVYTGLNYFWFGQYPNLKYLHFFYVPINYTLKNAVFWDVAPCISCEFNRRLGETYRLHLQGRKYASEEPA
jgi:hypothetical protein